MSENTVKLKNLTEDEKNEKKAAAEAILFVMGESVEASKLGIALGMTKDDVVKLMDELKDDYDKEGRGLNIIRLEDSYQMCSKKNLYDYLIKIASVPKRHNMTDVMLETLSIIAYKQPVTKSEIEEIRGVKSDHSVNKLVEYNLVCEVGRLDAPGRPILFGTTEEFLRQFGIESKNELPNIDPDKFEEFREEAEAEIPGESEQKKPENVSEDVNDKEAAEDTEDPENATTEG